MIRPRLYYDSQSMSHYDVNHFPCSTKSYSIIATFVYVNTCSTIGRYNIEYRVHKIELEIMINPFISRRKQSDLILCAYSSYLPLRLASSWAQQEIFRIFHIRTPGSKKFIFQKKYYFRQNLAKIPKNSSHFFHFYEFFGEFCKKSRKVGEKMMKALILLKIRDNKIWNFFGKGKKSFKKYLQGYLDQKPILILSENLKKRHSLTCNDQVIPYNQGCAPINDPVLEPLSLPS